MLRICGFLMVFFRHIKTFTPGNWYENIPGAWVLYTPAWAGVWIFITLSGYGIGAGFRNGKYQLSLKGLLEYYQRRIIRIVPIYWIYLILVIVFWKPEYLLPGITSLKALLKLFLFSYQEEFDSDYFGVAWYLTTLIRLYLLAPLFVWIIEKIKKLKISPLLVYALLAIGGMALRLAMRQYILSGEDRFWAILVYKPWYFNIDFFVGGMLLNELKDKKFKRYLPVLPWIILLGCNLIMSKEHFYTSYYWKTEPLIYQYLGPTLYLLITSLFIVNYDVSCGIKIRQKSANKISVFFSGAVRKIGELLLPMYLFHTVIAQLLLVGTNGWYWYVVETMQVPPLYQTFAISCLYAAVTLVYTVLWSAFVQYGMEPGFSRILNKGLKKFGTWIQYITGGRNINRIKERRVENE